MMQGMDQGDRQLETNCSEEQRRIRDIDVLMGSQLKSVPTANALGEKGQSRWYASHQKHSNEAPFTSLT